MEASVYSEGVVRAKEQQILRTPRAGLVKLGWYEGRATIKGKTMSVRLDEKGNGVSHPGEGESQTITSWTSESNQEKKSLAFHRLQEGEFLWPGQLVAQIESVSEMPDLSSKSGTPRFHSLRVPPTYALWQVLKIYVDPSSFVKPGDAIVMIVPVHPATKEPLDLFVELKIPEEKAAEVAVGQKVRIYSQVFNRRLHGSAQAELRSLSPLAEEDSDGKRQFRAVADVNETPFPLRLGSTVQVQVIIGRRPVYRLILEK